MIKMCVVAFALVLSFAVQAAPLGSVPSELSGELTDLCSKSVPTGKFEKCVKNTHAYVNDLKLRLDLCVKRSKPVIGDLRSCSGNSAQAILLSMVIVDFQRDAAKILSDGGLIVRSKLSNGKRAMSFSPSVAAFMGASRLVSFRTSVMIER